MGANTYRIMQGFAASQTEGVDTQLLEYRPRLLDAPCRRAPAARERLRG